MSDQDASQAQGEGWLDAWLAEDGKGYTKSADEMRAAIRARLGTAPGATAQDGAERHLSGETVCGFEVAAYRETHPEHGAQYGHTYSEHWSTPNRRDPRVKVERLFTETQLREALATPTPTIPAGMVAWNGGDSAPDDIGEASEVLHADGSIGPANKRSILWGRPKRKPGASTDWERLGPRLESKWIIAYTPLAAAPKQAEQQGVEIARLFHDTYERLAPSFGYETRADTKAFDPDSPNGKLMTAVCGYVAAALNAPTGAVEKERGA